jgi:[amino group carrier protein]-lysine/ornithine hydrolase
MNEQLNTKSREFLEALVRTPSVSRSEKAAAELCVARMHELGYAHAGLDAVGNAVAANYDYRKDPHADVLLFSHLDTVPGFWEVRSDDDGISGRGAVDAKGCLASMIEAGIRAPKGLKIVVAGVTEEEIPTSTGIRHLLTYLSPALAVNGEPSNCDGITIAYKGRMLVECRWKGQAAHAGMKADNPIEKVMEYYERLRNHFPRHHTFDSVIFNVTHIDYGSRSALNIIPEKLDFFIDVRVPPKEDMAKIESMFRESAPHGIEVEVKESFPGCAISENHGLVRAMVAAIRATGNTPRYVRKSASADMNITMAEGIPTVAYGPGDSKLDHTDREFMHWKDYNTAISTLAAFLGNVPRQGKVD